MRGMFKMAESGWRVLRMDLPYGLQTMLDEGARCGEGIRRKSWGWGTRGLTKRDGESRREFRAVGDNSGRQMSRARDSVTVAVWSREGAWGRKTCRRFFAAWRRSAAR